jgi:hypothetical protein
MPPVQTSTVQDDTSSPCPPRLTNQRIFRRLLDDVSVHLIKIYSFSSYICDCFIYSCFGVYFNMDATIHTNSVSLIFPNVLHCIGLAEMELIFSS